MAHLREAQRVDTQALWLGIRGLVARTTEAMALACTGGAGHGRRGRL
jgi:hypothetical protein